MTDEADAVQALHSEVRDALMEKFWHRAPLGPGASQETSRLLAYLYMEVGDDMSTFFRFVQAEPTTMTAERLVRRAEKRDIDPNDAYRYDWALQNQAGEMVAMPSEEQIQAAAVAVAKAAIGERRLPVALVAFMESLNSPARFLEFWTPARSPTLPLWQFFKPRMLRSYL